MPVLASGHQICDGSSTLNVHIAGLRTAGGHECVPALEFHFCVPMLQRVCVCVCLYVLLSAQLRAETRLYSTGIWRRAKPIRRDRYFLPFP